MKKSLFIFILIIFSCSTDKNIVPDISLVIENKLLNNRNTLNLKLINNSLKNYFICLDTTSFFLNSAFTEDFSNSTNLRALFYKKEDSIAIFPKTIMHKSMFLDTIHSNCVRKKIIKIQFDIEDFKNLKRILVLKSKDSISFKIPFSNTFELCNKEYYYFDQNGTYALQLKYKLKQSYFLETVDTTKLKILKKNNIEPFYRDIISNKVQLIIKNK